MVALLLLAISLSLDAFAVAFAQGLQNTRIPLLSKLILCLSSLLYFGLAVGFGALLAGVLSPTLSGIIGLILMFGFFLFMLLEVFLPGRFSRKKRKKKKRPTAPKPLIDCTLRSLGLTITVLRDPTLSDLDGSRSISGVEALFLGAALSVDSIGVGLGYSLSGTVGALDVLAVGLIQLLFLSLGNALGQKLHTVRFLRSDRLQLVSCAVILFLLVLRVIDLCGSGRF